MLLIIIVVLSLSIGYSALNTDLSISGEAIVRADSDIRITDVTLMTTNNGAVEIYTSNYSKNDIQLFVNLPINSSITYEIEITNNSEFDYYLSSLDFNENDSIDYEISTKIYDVYHHNDVQSFQVTITNIGNNEQQVNSSINMDFIRDEEPTIALNNLETSITKGDSYEIVKEYTTGPSGGEIHCFTSFGERVDNISDITKTGMQEVTCMVVTNTGKSVSDTISVTITYDAYLITNIIDDSSFEKNNTYWDFPQDDYNGIVTNEYHSGTRSLHINDFTNTNNYWIVTRYLFPENHHFYASVYTKYISEKGGVMAITDDGSATSDKVFNLSTLTPNRWVNNTFLAITNGNEDTIQIGSSVTNKTNVYIDDVLLIDLTDTFGAGNEPSKEWCDRHISYFDGTITIYK